MRREVRAVPWGDVKVNPDVTGAQARAFAEILLTGREEPYNALAELIEWPELPDHLPELIGAQATHAQVECSALQDAILCDPRLRAAIETAYREVATDILTRYQSGVWLPEPRDGAEILSRAIMTALATGGRMAEAAVLATADKKTTAWVNAHVAPKVGDTVALELDALKLEGGLVVAVVVVRIEDDGTLIYDGGRVTPSEIADGSVIVHGVVVGRSLALTIEGAEAA